MQSADDRKTILSLEHVEKSFGSNMVLKDISVEVKEGEVVSIIGSSGGGKSTLLRCATLLETFERGKLMYGDLLVARNNPAGQTVYGDKRTLAAARAKFGLVFQNFNLFPHRTVLQNISDAPILVKKIPRDEAEAKAMELVAKMGLQGKEHMVPCELSGGQQQRVAIARALCMEPRCCSSTSPRAHSTPS